MARYDQKSQDKVKETMEEFKEGELKSGSGKKVVNKKQAIAIGLAQARKEGSKAPASPRKKTTDGKAKPKTAKSKSAKATAANSKKSTSAPSKKKTTK